MIHLLALLVTSAIADPGAVRIERSWVFEREERHWRRIPPKTGASYDAQAVFTVVFPNGDLVQVAGWVFRTRSGRVSLCTGCGFVVWSGTWTRNSSKLSTRLVLRSSAVEYLDPATKQRVPEEKRPIREETWIVEERGLGRRLVLPDGRYRPLSRQFDDFERLQALAQP